MNLLVGATGFVGGHLVGYLFEQGEISKATFRMGSHLKQLDASGVQGIEADLLDHHSLHEAMEGVDVVYNLASPMPDSDSDFQKINTEGLLNLLETSTEANVKAFVHLSTLDIYGFRDRAVSTSSLPNPSNEYQRSKAEADRLLGEYSKRKETPRVVIMRPAKAIGSRDGSVAVPLLRMLKSGKVVLPDSGPMSFTHPRDIAQAMYKAATHSSKTGSSFLLKSFDASPKELATALSSELGLRADVKRPGLFGSPSLPQYAFEQLRASLVVEPQPSWAEIEYVPAYNLKSTCEEIAGWYRKEPWVAGDA